MRSITITVNDRTITIKYKDYNEYKKIGSGKQPRAFHFDYENQSWKAHIDTSLDLMELYAQLKEFIEQNKKYITNDISEVLSFFHGNIKNKFIDKGKIYLTDNLMTPLLLQGANTCIRNKLPYYYFPDCIGLRQLINIELNTELFPFDFQPRNHSFCVKYEFLLPHQLDGVEWIISKFTEGYPGVMLADEMGLGKTVQSLAAYFTMKDSIPDLKLMIVAPKSVLKNAWALDMYKFFKQPCEIITAKNIGTMLEIAKKKPIVVNYELLSTYYKNKESPRLDSSFVLILDETTKVKNHKTGNYSVISKLRGDSFVIALSGTPIENKAEELYNVMSIVLNERFMPFWYFSNFFIEFEERYKNGRKYKVISKYRNTSTLHKVIAPFMLRRTKKILENYIEKDVKTVIVDITPEQERLINELRQIARKRFRDDEIQRRACTTLIKRINDHPLLLELGDSELAKSLKVEDKTSPKLNALKEILRQVKLPVVIFTEYEDMAKILYDELSTEYKPCMITGSSSTNSRNKIVEDIQNGVYNILIATDAMAYGVNLQFIDTLINYDLPWNPARRSQRINRIHRIGSLGSKVVYDILTSDIDLAVYNVVKRKTRLFEEVIENKQVTTVSKEITTILLKGTDRYGDKRRDNEDLMEELLNAVRE
ncbi:MAG TPA: DEAD/DEAH box helicase [Fervidobacterium nodosum]|nr:DEAD/DEAH box helicase [Fervidobacterium nodosum]